MGIGVLAQLVKTKESSRSVYLIKNPEISYFKFAYKRHTNFSMQTFKLTFNNNPVLNKDNVKFRCPINKNGANIVTDLYYRYQLPDIYSNDKYKFRWVPNFGCLLVKRADFWINNRIIDSITGEWLVISTDLTESVKDNFNKLTGNLSSFSVPKMDIPVITINNNRYNSSYPNGNRDLNQPSMKGREIIVPLSFNFTKNPALGLLLTKINSIEGATNNIYIEIILEDIENLYQVYSSDLNMYVSPVFYNELYPNDLINIDTFVKNKNLNSYIEANYIYLDNDEALTLQQSYHIDIVMDQLFISSEYTLTPGTDLVNSIKLMKCNTHIKEIIWTIKRDDFYKYNTHTNYTNSIPENSDNSIMNKASIIFNKTIERVPENDGNFFNIIQPYKHHASIPRQGIYCYSYALFPDKFQPSGSIDCGTIETILNIYTNNQDNSAINQKLIKFGKISPYSYAFRLNYYIRCVNILRYLNGDVKFVFDT